MLKSVLCFVVGLSYLMAGNTEITIRLKPVNADSLKIIEPSFSPARPVKENKLLEKITAYPANYATRKLYQFHIQNFLKLSKLFKEDSVLRASVKSSALPATIDFLERIYPPPPLDDIVSACWLEDGQGNDFFVFDANNDEDFTNDRILKFKDFDQVFAPEHSGQYVMAEELVTVEIFDGQQVKTQKMLLAFFKAQKPGGKNLVFFSNRLIRMGELKLDGEVFNCILFTILPDVNYKITDFLWIDLNHDKRYNRKEDFYEQLYQPFTLRNKSYGVKTLDIWGRSLTLEELDAQKTPPIAVGLACPEFEVAFIDSTKFSLAQAKGRYLVIDFWMCSDQYCDMMSKKLLEKLSDQNSVYWISCPYGAQSYERLKAMGGIAEDDFRHFVAPHEIERFRRLFQVRTNKVLFVINPQGKIESIENFTQDQTEQIFRQISEAD
ncbi:peroxiredoxin family protein [Caldithrix abyssi]